MFTRDQLPFGVYGGVGGILPNLLDLANQLINQDLGKWFDATTSIFWALFGPVCAYLIYFGIGGFIAMAFEETKPIKAIVLGISAPALIAAWLSGSGDLSSTQPARLGQLFGIGTAHAADEHEDWSDIVVKAPEHPKEEAFLDYEVLAYDGAVVDYGSLDKPGAKAVQVPPNGKIRFFGKDVNEMQLTDPKEGEVYQVELQRNYWNYFWRALGDRSKEPYDVNVQASMGN